MRSLLPLLVLAPAAVDAQLGPNHIYPMTRWNDSTFVDDYEVSVAEWIEFMQDGGGTEPDTSILSASPYSYLFYGSHRQETRDLRAPGVYYRVRIPIPTDSMRTKDQRIRAERHAQYPITGISHEQALAFCTWRTALYNDVERRYGDSLFTVTFELPSAQEMDALLTSSDSTNGTCATFNYNCSPCQTQLKISDKLRFIRPGRDLTPVDGYSPDPLGLMNLRGNAAEMTVSSGIAKGGSYREPASECTSGKTQPYTKPEPWLGFRCVARVRAR